MPSGDSASPDAPASFVAYAPYSAAGVGLDTAVLTLQNENRAFRLGTSALVAFANANPTPALPSQLVHTAFELSGAWSFERWAKRQWGTGSVLELGLGVGRRWAFATEGYWLLEPYDSDDVPFGAGGWYLGIGAQARKPLSETWDLDARLGGRGYTNAWPDLFGQGEISDLVADGLNEGARWQLSGELGTRWHAFPRFEPFAWLYADLIDPHDDVAKTLWLARVQTGGAVPFRNLEWQCFGSAEAGHGTGLLVNRTELRLGLGMKLYARQ